MPGPGPPGSMIRVVPSAVRTVAGIASTAGDDRRAPAPPAARRRPAPGRSGRAGRPRTRAPACVSRAASAWVWRLRPAHHWWVCRAPVASPSRRRSASAATRHSSRVRRLDAPVSSSSSRTTSASDSTSERHLAQLGERSRARAPARGSPPATPPAACPGHATHPRGAARLARHSLAGPPAPPWAHRQLRSGPVTVRWVQPDDRLRVGPELARSNLSSTIAVATDSGPESDVRPPRVAGKDLDVSVRCDAGPPSGPDPAA